MNQTVKGSFVVRSAEILRLARSHFLNNLFLDDTMQTNFGSSRWRQNGVQILSVDKNFRGAYIEHQKEVVTRRTIFDKEKQAFVPIS